MKELVEKLGEPLERLLDTRLADDGTHEKLDGPDSVGRIRLGVLAKSVHEAELLTKLILANSVGEINLVTEHKEGGVGKHLVSEELVELLLGLRETFPVEGVNNIHNAVNRRKKVLPELACCLMATQVVGLESNVTNYKFLMVGVKSRGVDCYAVIFEHVKKRGLACVIETEEENFGILVVDAEPAKDSVEPIKEAHFAVNLSKKPERTRLLQKTCNSSRPASLLKPKEQ
mmetsp:Transcript_7984/g.15829  ORF Transcript_7984/g.15829 Transcript_7984/m.15829 type:complete len:230 (+) Transcript_7984:304-993(+)